MLFPFIHDISVHGSFWFFRIISTVPKALLPRIILGSCCPHHGQLLEPQGQEGRWLGPKAYPSCCRHVPMSLKCVNKSSDDSRVSSVNALGFSSDSNDTSSDRKRFFILFVSWLLFPLHTWTFLCSYVQAVYEVYNISFNPHWNVSTTDIIPC